MRNDHATRVLVAYGSKREGTAEIARAIAEVLRERGCTVDCLPADHVADANAYDAVIVGGALYMLRWHRAARNFVAGNAPILRARPTWLFSSGPLDGSAAAADLPPVREVAHLAARIGARGHATFGGRLARDARGFPAAAMARTHAGDWRDWDQIRAWATGIADALRAEPAQVRPHVVLPARWPLASLCLLVGVAALLGGLGLALRPDGALLHLPLTYLAYTPFTDYLVPGLMLAGVIGGGSLVAALLVMRWSARADLAGLVAGAALIIWVTAQMLLLRTQNALQLGTLAVATLIVAESLRRLTLFDGALRRGASA